MDSTTPVQTVKLIEEKGDFDLVQAELQSPVPANHVVIRVHYSTVNPYDRILYRDF